MYCYMEFSSNVIPNHPQKGRCWSCLHAINLRHRLSDEQVRDKTKFKSWHSGCRRREECVRIIAAISGVFLGGTASSGVACVRSLCGLMSSITTLCCRPLRVWCAQLDLSLGQPPLPSPVQSFYLTIILLDYSFFCPAHLSPSFVSPWHPHQRR